MNLWLMMHDFIRLTTIILSSNYSQTKKKPLSDESSTIVRRIKLCITSIKSLHTTNYVLEKLRLVHFHTGYEFISLPAYS